MKNQGRMAQNELESPPIVTQFADLAHHFLRRREFCNNSLSFVSKVKLQSRRTESVWGGEFQLSV